MHGKADEILKQPSFFNNIKQNNKMSPLPNANKEFVQNTTYYLFTKKLGDFNNNSIFRLILYINFLS